MGGRRGIRGEADITCSQGAPRDCRSNAAQRGTESLGHRKAAFVLAVFRGDDHSVSVYADAIGPESKSFEFRAQNVQVDQSAGRNQEARLGPDETSRQLAQQDHVAVRLLERMPVVGPAAPNADVDLLLEGDNCGDLALAFRAELPAHYDPDTRVDSPILYSSSKP